jgi:hypothetical protein
MVAFLECSAGARVRTNNHVEHANRRLRFDEKVRYKIRTEFAGASAACVWTCWAGTP